MELVRFGVHVSDSQEDLVPYFGSPLSVQDIS